MFIPIHTLLAKSRRRICSRRRIVTAGLAAVLLSSKPTGFCGVFDAEFTSFYFVGGTNVLHAAISL